MGIEGIALGIAGELIYSPPAMLYSSYEVLYNCYTIENNANYNAILLISYLSVYAATRQVKELRSPIGLQRPKPWRVATIDEAYSYWRTSAMTSILFCFLPKQ